MTGQFDIRTLFLAGALTSLSCAVTIFAMRRLHRPSIPAVAWGALGLACMGLSMLGIALRGQVPGFVTYTLANTLGPIGAVVFYESTRRLCHARPLPWVAAGASAAIFAFQVWLGDGPQPNVERLLMTSFVQGGCCVLMIPLLVRRLRLDPPVPVACAIALVSTIAVAHAARSVSILAFGVQTSPGGEYAIGGLQAAVAGMFTLAPMLYAMNLTAWVNARMGAELRRWATTDELTGLASRRTIFQRARELLAPGAGRGPGVTGLLMIDLDFFKQVNDRHGHRVGDRVLAHVACTLQRALRPGDEIGRYGGEEFCAIVRRPDDAGVHAAADAVCAAVRDDPFVSDGVRIDLSVSIGVATSAQTADFDELLSVADRLLYLAKALGRDRVATALTPRPPHVRRADDLKAPREARSVSGAIG